MNDTDRNFTKVVGIIILIVFPLAGGAIYFSRLFTMQFGVKWIGTALAVVIVVGWLSSVYARMTSTGGAAKIDKIIEAYNVEWDEKHQCVLDAWKRWECGVPGAKQEYFALKQEFENWSSAYQQYIVDESMKIENNIVRH